MIYLFYKNTICKYLLAKKILIVFVFLCFNSGYSQIDTTISLTFDFNEQLIKEKDNKIKIKPVGISLTEDRFGNSKSAIYLHGHPDSYLNLGTSEILKPKNGTISIWVNLDRKIFAGKGSESNPIIATKNGILDDFNYAYGIYYDLKTNRIGLVSHKDSTLDLNLKSVDEIEFNNWYHVVFIISDKYFAFYINGELQQLAPKRFEITYLFGDSVIVGNTANKKNNRWSQGLFDDIQIFHKALTAQEIKDLYNAPNPNRLRNIFNEFLKYGIIILILGGIIILLIFRNKRNLNKQKEQLELINRISELELKVVKAQMNPHFISNCLAAIQELIYNNEVDKAGQYLAKFSYFLRQVLNYSDRDFIAISEEIEIIKLNVELEQLRFKNEFDFQLIIDEKINSDEVLIPALITQPFIENAIWHGLLPLNNIRKPKLKINILLQDGLPIIEIEDNGVGRDLAKLLNENSKGTKLVIDKIDSLNRLYSTSNYKMEIVDLTDEDEKQIGTKIRIQLDTIKE